MIFKSKLSLTVILCAVLMINTAHTFINVDPATQWKLYDMGNCLSILVAYSWVFSLISWKNTFPKIASLFFVVDSFKEVLDLVISNNDGTGHALYVQNIFIAIMIFCIYKISKWHDRHT